jgi:hypothetical protein
MSHIKLKSEKLVQENDQNDDNHMADDNRLENA